MSIGPFDSNVMTLSSVETMGRMPIPAIAEITQEILERIKYIFGLVVTFNLLYKIYGPIILVEIPKAATFVLL